MQQLQPLQVALGQRAAPSKGAHPAHSKSGQARGRRSPECRSCRPARPAGRAPPPAAPRRNAPAGRRRGCGPPSGRAPPPPGSAGPRAGAARTCRAGGGRASRESVGRRGAGGSERVLPLARIRCCIRSAAGAPVGAQVWGHVYEPLGLHQLRCIVLPSGGAVPPACAPPAAALAPTPRRGWRAAAGAGAARGILQLDVLRAAGGAAVGTSAPRWRGPPAGSSWRQAAAAAAVNALDSSSPPAPPRPARPHRWPAAWPGRWPPCAPPSACRGLPPSGVRHTSPAAA